LSHDQSHDVMHISHSGLSQATHGDLQNFMV